MTNKIIIRDKQQQQQHFIDWIIPRVVDAVNDRVRKDSQVRAGTHYPWNEESDHYIFLAESLAS